MPNDDTNATIDPNPAQEPNDAWRQRGAKILQAIATAQLDPMYRFEIAEGFDDDDSMCQPDDDDYEPIQDIDPPVSDWEKCPHCNQRSVSISRHRRDSSHCDNCGPLECFSCERTLKRRNSEVTSAGFELYCPSCEHEEREERAHQQESEERLFSGRPPPPMRKGKTAKNRQRTKTFERELRMQASCSVFVTALQQVENMNVGVEVEIIDHRPYVGAPPTITAEAMHPTRTKLTSRELVLEPFHIRWMQRGLGAFLTFSFPELPKEERFISCRISRSPALLWFLRIRGLTAPRSVNRTKGRLTKSERREEESLRATPTREPRNQDEERFRHRGDRCGTKRTRWTPFRRAPASKIEARHIELPAYERKGSRSSRMTVSRTCAYGKRPVHSTLAQVENRTVKIDDEPMHLLESVPSRKHYPGSWR